MRASSSRAAPLRTAIESASSRLGGKISIRGISTCGGVRDITPMDKSRGFQPSRVDFPVSLEIACIELSPNAVLRRLHRPKFPRAPRYIAILEENRRDVNPCVSASASKKDASFISLPITLWCLLTRAQHKH